MRDAVAEVSPHQTGFFSGIASGSTDFARASRSGPGGQSAQTGRLAGRRTPDARFVGPTRVITGAAPCQLQRRICWRSLGTCDEALRRARKVSFDARSRPLAGRLGPDGHPRRDGGLRGGLPGCPGHLSRPHRLRRPDRGGVAGGRRGVRLVAAAAPGAAVVVSPVAVRSRAGDGLGDGRRERHDGDGAGLRPAGRRVQHSHRCRGRAALPPVARWEHALPRLGTRPATAEFRLRAGQRGGLADAAPRPARAGGVELASSAVLVHPQPRRPALRGGGGGADLPSGAVVPARRRPGAGRRRHARHRRRDPCPGGGGCPLAPRLPGHHRRHRQRCGVLGPRDLPLPRRRRSGRPRVDAARPLPVRTGGRRRRVRPRPHGAAGGSRRRHGRGRRPGEPLPPAASGATGTGRGARGGHPIGPAGRPARGGHPVDDGRRPRPGRGGPGGHAQRDGGPSHRHGQRRRAPVGCAPVGRRHRAVPAGRRCRPGGRGNRAASRAARWSCRLRS